MPPSAGFGFLKNLSATRFSAALLLKLPCLKIAKNTPFLMPAAENGYFLANMIFLTSIRYETVRLKSSKKGDTLLYIPISKRHFQKVRFQVIPISAYSAPMAEPHILYVDLTPHFIRFDAAQCRGAVSKKGSKKGQFTPINIRFDAAQCRMADFRRVKKGSISKGSK